jgi:hypothetical protein
MRRSILSVLLTVLVLIPSAVRAQEALIEMLRADVRAEKVAIITETMMFTDEQAEAFWPVYRKYEAELSGITDAALANMKDYAENYDSMTDKKAKEIVKRSFKNQERRLALQKKYYERFSKILGPITAAKFFQLEREINLLIDLQIAEALPFFK